MDPNQQELYRVIIDYLQNGRYIDLAVYLLIVYLPFVPVFIHSFFKNRKIEKLYKERLADKDAEIERQATRIKEIENLTLKTKRK
jgi:hypothetical protein